VERFSRSNWERPSLEARIGYARLVSTTVHLPAPLLARIDERAKELGLSRNRFIVATLYEKVGEPDAWPTEFVGALKRPLSAEAVTAAHEMLHEIESSRRSRKRPPRIAPR
jgi:hypothetical protein